MYICIYTYVHAFTLQRFSHSPVQSHKFIETHLNVFQKELHALTSGVNVRGLSMRSLDELSTYVAIFFYPVVNGNYINNIHVFVHHIHMYVNNICTYTHGLKTTLVSRNSRRTSG